MDEITNQKLRILIVEDNPADVFLIKFYLEELDPEYYIISHVDNLKDANKILDFEEFDSVLLDLHLPDSQGMETLTKSVKKFPNHTFIVLTALADQRLGIEAVQNGAQDFLTKGQFDGNSLDSSIKFALHRSRMKHKIQKYLEILNTVNEMNEMSTFIIQPSSGRFEHTNNFAAYIGLAANYEVNSLEELLGMTDDSKALEAKIDETIKSKKMTHLNSNINKISFSINILKGANGIIGTLKKL